MVSKAIDLGLRGIQFLWTLLVMALVGDMISDALGGNPSIINYDMFVAVFSMLSLIFLITSAFTGIMSESPIPLALDVLNTLFFFCGAVAMAAQLGAHSCTNTDYIDNNSITNGADNKVSRCREAQAVTTFMWFAFAAYAVSCFFSAMTARSGGVNLRGNGIRKGGPAMSQV